MEAKMLNYDFTISVICETPEKINKQNRLFVSLVNKKPKWPYHLVKHVGKMSHPMYLGNNNQK